jgi:hypothetical protein
MNPFASHTTKTVPLPFDPPNDVTIRRLSGRHLEKARQENQFASVDTLKRMGGATFQKELAELGTEQERADAIKKQQADPLNSYDPYVLCAKGIISWSYPESLKLIAVVDEESERVVEAVKALAAFADKKGVIADVIPIVMDAAKAMRMAIPAIEDLADEAVDFLAREILKLSKPALFQTKDEIEAAQKNALEPSTVP